MTNFDANYKKLNARQKLAVDQIEGPVLVIAGPGTGKTQLLGMRAANILVKTDTPPSSILCLTFTESAASEMRSRLVELIGQDGNKIAIHTFHSFGSEIINTYPDFFYEGAKFKPADELTTYEILNDLFKSLPHDNPLNKTMNGEFTALKDTLAAISHLKRAGITPNELSAILDYNQKFYDFAEPILSKVFSARLSKKQIPEIKEALHQLNNFKPGKLILDFVKPIHNIAKAELEKAVNDCGLTGKTNALTLWRNHWMTRNNDGALILKDNQRAKKLRALVEIFKNYQKQLMASELFDFNDMVSLVAHTLETQTELRLNNQEKFLYIMVDEFQDTNGAQMRLLNALIGNDMDQSPNILAVGDDDQAIYSFQGAEISNILDFKNRFDKTEVITLTENYRSTMPILKSARNVITQGSDRLENNFKNINKKLNANKAGGLETQNHQFTSPQAELEWVADKIKNLVNSGVQEKDIAVIARGHKHLHSILPYLHDAGLHINYERRSNVLEDVNINELLILCEVVNDMAEQRFDLAQSKMPELLSCRFWRLPTAELWQLSINAYQSKRLWLELMIEAGGRPKQIAEFLIIASHMSHEEPLDTMLDILIGSNEVQESDTEFSEPAKKSKIDEELLISPFRAYYFNETSLNRKADQYLSLLSNLRALREALKNWRPATNLFLKDLNDFVSLHKQTGIPIVNMYDFSDADESINLMTAHKAKGLEFEAVFVLNCQDSIWGRSARVRHTQLGFPANLPIEPAGARWDDSLRLFFVAMTRAKSQLYLTSYEFDSTGKKSLLAEFLHTEDFKPEYHDHSVSSEATKLEPGWQARHTDLSGVDSKTLLTPLLSKYKLSATHLNNFTDVSRGGPQAFLLQNLLRFPQAMGQGAVFGKAIHSALNRAQNHLKITNERRPIEDVMKDFEMRLMDERLSERDFTYLLQKGSDILPHYLNIKYPTFSPEDRSERSFAGQNVVVGDTRLTGAIDLMKIDKKNKLITVIDFKTGKPFTSWRAYTDFDKIKLHKYKQQLLLYKLLIENSRDWQGYKVEKGILDFVEAGPDGQLHQIELDLNAEDLVRFKKLLGAVWQKIMKLDFEDTSKYSPDHKGTLEFEESLLRES